MFCYVCDLSNTKKFLVIFLISLLVKMSQKKKRKNMMHKHKFLRILLTKYVYFGFMTLKIKFWKRQNNTTYLISYQLNLTPQYQGFASGKKSKRKCWILFSKIHQKNIYNIFLLLKCQMSRSSCWYYDYLLECDFHVRTLLEIFVWIWWY